MDLASSDVKKVTGVSHQGVHHIHIVTWTFCFVAGVLLRGVADIAPLHIAVADLKQEVGMVTAMLLYLGAALFANLGWEVWRYRTTLSVVFIAQGFSMLGYAIVSYLINLVS